MPRLSGTSLTPTSRRYDHGLCDGPAELRVKTEVTGWKGRGPFAAIGQVVVDDAADIDGNLPWVAGLFDEYVTPCKRGTGLW